MVARKILKDGSVSGSARGTKSFATVTEAARYVAKSRGSQDVGYVRGVAANIWNAANGNRPSAYGFVWQ